MRLEGIAIHRDNLSLASFKRDDAVYTRTEDGNFLVIEPLNERHYNWYVNGEFTSEFSEFHVLQNLFEDATGKLLALNLVGSK